ncbi:MAG: acyl-CoA ligase (AMP-forming), exosortase A system-associated [Kangiellaceae bacterium]
MPFLFHHLVSQSSQNHPHACALISKGEQKDYQSLNAEVERVANGLIKLGLKPNQRVAVYLPKQFESVISFFSITLAGGVFVPVNPLLKPNQVEYILKDCDVEILITSKSRYKQLISKLNKISANITLVTDQRDDEAPIKSCEKWQSLLKAEMNNDIFPERISQDMAAILYTSGSTGQPKGVVLSHQNLVEGAKSVASYLKNTKDDRLLAVLPFSFDYGLSQLTTAFLKGASVVLLEYLLPRDVINTVAKFEITGLAAVPPLWSQLASLEWPEEAKHSLRYITNSGGAMPKTILKQLRGSLPSTAPYLMYGLTEAFRSTYLEPSEIDKRPNSIGKAIPNAEILVINDNGHLCEANEEGELVHRGIHVAMGYWNAPKKTAERFKPIPSIEVSGLISQMAVWSGDRVKKDEDGFLYFVGRNDEMIKSSGYRISPAEIEECLYQMNEVTEVIAFGVADETLGQKIQLVLKQPEGIENSSEKIDAFKKLVFSFCKKNLPNFMQPHQIKLLNNLPKNANGKIDRSLLKAEHS